jgi:MFS family permease
MSSSGPNQTTTAKAGKAGRIDSRSLMFILLFTLAHFVHHILTSILVPLLPFIRDDFGLNYTQAGAIVSAYSLAYGFGQLPAGWIADRVGPRYLLWVGISGVALAAALLGLSTNYIGMIIFLVIMGVLGGGYHPSAAPLIAAAVPPAVRGKAIGIHIIGGSFSLFAAPLTAVFIAGLIGWRGAYLSTSIPVFLFGIWLFILMTRNARWTGIGNTELDEAVASRDQQAEQILQNTESASGNQVMGSTTTQGMPDIVFFMVMTAVFGAVTTATTSFVPLFMVDILGLDQRLAGFFFSLYFAIGMVAAPVSGALVDRFGPIKVFMVAAVLAGPAIILIGLSEHWIILVPLLLLLGFSVFMRMTASEMFFVSRVSERRRSTLLGIYFFAGNEANGIITPFLGSAIDAWGFTAMFTGIGFILIVSFVLCGTIFMIRYCRVQRIAVATHPPGGLM